MEALIEARNLKKHFDSPKGKVHAVDDISFKIMPGRTMGVVGESGCGKSTLGRTMIHLLQSTEGSIYFEGKDVTKVKDKALMQLREKMQIIFQDPYASLNPRMTVKTIIQEPLILSKRFSDRGSLEAETVRLMDLVGIEERLRNAYPHELDGGRRQRVGIGRALALNPKFVVCDEPVSALDVSIQAQVVNMLMKFQRELGLTYLFIAHDLSMVRHIADETAVMYLGTMVEYGPTGEVYGHPAHPYTKGLLSAVPVADPDYEKTHRRIPMEGEVPSPINPKPGCRFCGRCPWADGQCRTQTPALKDLGGGHFAACHQLN